MKERDKKDLLKAISESNLLRYGNRSYMNYQGLEQFCLAIGLPYSKRTFYNKVNKKPGELPHSVKMGKCRYFEFDEVCRWMDSMLGSDQDQHDGVLEK